MSTIHIRVYPSDWNVRQQEHARAVRLRHEQQELRRLEQAQQRAELQSLYGGSMVAGGSWNPYSYAVNPGSAWGLSPAMGATLPYTHAGPCAGGVGAWDGACAAQNAGWAVPGYPVAYGGGWYQPQPQGLFARIGNFFGL
jgi:hypothetical protein